MNDVSRIKAAGYLTSGLSVILLGIPAMKSAMADPEFAACLVSGMALSVAGMALRWKSHRRDQLKQDRDR